jgi:hypothetical protein
MAFNVSAVCEVLGARIGKHKSEKYHSYPAFVFAGAQNLAEWGVGTRERSDRLT